MTPGPEAPAGLVSYAIVAPKTESPDAAELGVLDGYFCFPSGEMLDAAVSMWPESHDPVNGRDWHTTGVREVKHEGYRADGRRRVWYTHESIEISEHRTPTRGSWPRVEIAPGMLRFARHDIERAERAAARAADPENPTRKAYREYLVQLENAPMALAEVRPDRPGRVVSAWSRKSQVMMRRAIATLDLAPLVSGENIPAMVTLTLPGDWLAIAPTAAVMAEKFHRFTKAYVKKWGPLACIWKREFQRRGAPHYHLWMVPPVPQARMQEFRSWLSLAWTRALFSDQASVPGRDDRHGSDCRCSEWCRSLSAGTGVDFVAALRARDPNRLAEYFLKESGHSEAKAYQNGAPVEWEGQSVGRFWGVRGLEKSLRTVMVNPEHQYRVWRVMRRVRLARSMPTHQWTVPRGVAPTTGEVRTRRVTRPNRSTAAAGWVAVNDGASFGALLGRYASSLEGLPAQIHQAPVRTNRRGNRWRRVWSNRPTS